MCSVNHKKSTFGHGGGPYTALDTVSRITGSRKSYPPGLRGAGLWVGEEGLERTFADVEALVAECRFSDCGHESEPGCAVQAALLDGRLPERRLASWRKLQREALWMASRADARLRSEQRRAWKLVHMEMRRSGRSRP